MRFDITFCGNGEKLCPRAKDCRRVMNATEYATIATFGMPCSMAEFYAPDETCDWFLAREK